MLILQRQPPDIAPGMALLKDKTMTNYNEIERARSALQSISPDLPHDQWVRVGMAAKDGGLSFDEWDGWSQQGSNYNPTTARDAWRSFSDKPGGVKVATLFKIARESGWTDHSPRSSSGANQRKAPADAGWDVGLMDAVERAASGKTAPEKKFKPGMSPDEVWGRCEPVPPDHPYVVKKNAQNAPLSGLRMLPAGDWLHIAGNRMGGALVVPGYNFDGELCSLQFVPEEGGKLNLPGASISGLMHPLGEIVPGAKIQIVEGIGTAWTVWAAGDGLPVVAFGWGNVARVAAEWRQRDSAAQIGILPDVGQEENAAKIAATVGASVACMPAGWPNNADLNDLAQREGMDAVRAVLASAAQPAPAPKPEPRIHPLANFLSFDLTPRAPSWVLDGVIEEGVVVIAGMRGIGKTTTIAPLSLVAAGLHAFGDPMAPKAWRHVIYLTEHAAQVFRVLAGLVRFGGLGISEADVAERFHVVSTVRMQPEDVVSVASEYMAKFARVHRGVTLRPLVVFDTWSASFALESENDNSETGRAVACLKQRFEDMPVWIVAHMAKTAQGRSDVVNLSARGAGALEADTIQNLYLVHEGEGEDAKRFLSLKGKKRFEPKHGDEFEIESHHATVEALDAWGDTERTELRWNTLKPVAANRHTLKAEAKANEAKEAQTQLRAAILSRLDIARMTGEPLNRSGLKAAVKGFQGQSIGDTVELLVNEGWIVEVDIPASQRINVNKKAFLVGLKEEERRMLLAGQTLPPEVLAIPPAWKKAEIPSVPVENAEAPEKEVITPEMIATENPESAVPESAVPLKGKTDGNRRERTGTVPRHSVHSQADGNEREQTGTDGNDTIKTVAVPVPSPSGADDPDNGQEVF